MDAEELINTILGEAGNAPAPKAKTPRSMSSMKAREFNTVNTSKFSHGDKRKASMQPTVERTGAKSSVHGLNKSEQGQRMTYAEDALERREAGMKKRPYKEIEADPSTDAKDVWNTIQLYDEQNGGKDGSAFYALPGQQAFQELGIPENPELVDFWDRLDPEDRSLLMSAMADKSLVTDVDVIQENMGDDDGRADILKQMGVNEKE